ncbi:Heat shock transcription factor [Trachipleistophora hominis]|uniref:Heat shock transcription factor n=1 Tax=Trachipleistophora hominis TaxID=72359 RepID=L7JVF4_TRAHO|nr:Heat shock transcription factor [Trachipleistophora hominis]
MQSLTKEPKIETPSKFIIRLYAAIDDPNVTSVIWSRHETSFLILDKEHFQHHVLPMISKTTEFSGFIRQLNAYGFKKRNNIDPSVREYAHPNFIKNRFDLLTKLSRRSTGIVKIRECRLPEQHKISEREQFQAYV